MYIVSVHSRIPSEISSIHVGILSESFIESYKSFRHKVTCKELEQKASIIARGLQDRKKGPLDIPRAVVNAGKRAIAARKKCTNWFLEAGAQDKASDKGHEHFVDVLEQMLKTLHPWIPANYTRPVQSSQTPSLIYQGNTNLFERLTIEECEEEENSALPESTNKAKNVAPKPAAVEYELEVDELGDLRLMVFGFFEDLHKTRDFLKEVWTEVRANKMNFVVATIITNAAVAMIKAEEIRIVEQVPEEMQQKDSYLSMLRILFHQDDTSKYKDDFLGCFDHESTTSDKASNFLFLNTARQLGLMAFGYGSETAPK